MSTRRSATWEDSPHYGKRGPDGRRLCLECGEELSEKRKRFTFCGDDCRRAREVKCHPSAARRFVYERDRGMCARCSLDCGALDEELRRWGYTYVASCQTGYLYGQRSPLAIDWLREYGLPITIYGEVRSTWQAHHKHAVIEGGGVCTLDGYETLCWRCHASETKALHSRLSDKRRGRLRLEVTR